MRCFFPCGECFTRRKWSDDLNAHFVTELNSNHLHQLFLFCLLTFDYYGVFTMCIGVILTTLSTRLSRDKTNTVNTLNIGGDFMHNTFQLNLYYKCVINDRNAIVFVSVGMNEMCLFYESWQCRYWNIVRKLNWLIFKFNFNGKKTHPLFGIYVYMTSFESWLCVTWCHDAGLVQIRRSDYHW